jgi:hypothetical protein
MNSINTLTRSITAGTRFGSLRSVLLMCLVALCWLICTIAQVEKYLPLDRAIVLCGIGCLGVALLMRLLKRSYRRRQDIGHWPLMGLFCVLLLSFAVLYPKSQKHALGKGSDREDALRVELYAVTHHQYPYDARTYLGHAPTPLPGAMLLASPFYFAGRVAFQNLLWVGLFCLFLIRFFSRRTTALAFVFLFVLTALENLNDFDVGGDYMVNIMYISIALFLLAREASRPDMTWRTVLAVIFMGVALSSRVLYVVTVPPMFALLVQRNNLKRALLFISGVLLATALVTVPIFTPHALDHLLVQLNQNADKLRLLPSYLPSQALCIAMAVTCIAFFVRMTLERVYLLVGTASLIMIFPPMALFVRLEGGLGHPLTPDMEYLAVSSVFLSLWAFSRWEQTDMALLHNGVPLEDGQ